MIAALSGFGCFKVDVDPRTNQVNDSNDNLYFFLDGNLGITKEHLVFSHKHHIRNNVFKREIEIKNIRDFKWRPYSKEEHEVFGEEIRYLTSGLFWRLWMEVGYFWLPGGRDTEMECVITLKDETECYFYFRGIAINRDIMKHISEHINGKSVS